MSDVLGIVAEYNPFHNGHLYQVQKAKEKCGAKFTVCVMSGNFVQRGNTSIVDKWTKAQMALNNGVDLVLELPTVYSVSSAENFAEGAVKILENLGIVDAISFGVETENVVALSNIAGILSEESQEYVGMLKEELKKGVSFPSAREKALIKYLGQNDESAEYEKILSMPNNILGIEYLKALKQLKSNIIPIAVKREKVSYDDDSIVDGFASATAIRKLLSKKDFKALRKVVPQACYDILLKEYELGDVVLSIQKFEKEILYVLRKMSIDDIANLPDVTEGLEYSIKDAANLCNNIKDFINMVKTKRYTQTRIQRILTFALLGITKKDVQTAKEVVPYARVLGFSQNGKNLLSKISQKNPQMKVITSVKKFMDNNSNEAYKRMMEIDVLATNIYTLECRYSSRANLDFTRNMIIKNN